MSDELSGKKVAFLAADGVEQVELTAPWQAVVDAGATPTLVSIAPGRVQAYNGDVEPADTFDVGAVVTDVRASDFDALVLPGGTTNPDKLRMDDGAVAFVRDAFSAGLPVGVICHGPWTLITADLVRGRTLASWPSLQADLRNAGATWVDEEVVVDGGLVSSRNPDDLPAFTAKVVEVFARGTAASQAA